MGRTIWYEMTGSSDSLLITDPQSFIAVAQEHDPGHCKRKFARRNGL